eukprot:TRINITY_DN1950_c0_g1_i3.p1 TRINITY_DN1950_c0_g1~~TRINITY_DN1950_c0_g1_i3.p1  ORF type:complete len:227 (+),score=-9.89 TRINITY_DN1950_c0_g1_i3:304-984(+)
MVQFQQIELQIQKVKNRQYQHQIPKQTQNYHLRINYAKKSTQKFFGISQINFLSVAYFLNPFQNGIFQICCYLSMRCNNVHFFFLEFHKVYILNQCPIYIKQVYLSQNFIRYFQKFKSSSVSNKLIVVSISLTQTYKLVVIHFLYSFLVINQTDIIQRVVRLFRQNWQLESAQIEIDFKCGHVIGKLTCATFINHFVCIGGNNQKERMTSILNMIMQLEVIIRKKD